LAEESAHTLLPGDYSSEPGNGVSPAQAAEERRHQPVGALFNEATTDEERDLDVPAFMRRRQF